MNKSKSVQTMDVVKIYDGTGGKQVKAVDHVSLDIRPGEFITLLGPSGCGKTTMLRMIAGFERPTGGQIFIGGDKVTSLTPDKRDTAMVFQSYALFPHMNVFDNVAYGLRIKKLSAQEIKQRVEKILALAGLSGMESRNPNQLSGGQQQRVALARALVMEPGVLLFDEPLSNLDAKLRVHMRSEIRKIQQKLGITSIYVTHDQAEAMSMSDRVIVMNQGVVEQIGSPAEIYHQPATQFVADFIGLANIVEATVVESTPGQVVIKCLGSLFTLSTALTLQPGQVVKVIFRPETAVVSETGMIKAQVESSVFMGAYQDYHLVVNGKNIVVQEYNPHYKRIFQAGEEAGLVIDPRSLHLVQA